MRIWSIHPRYLDTKGIVALWREALLAKKVLERNTRGYTNHPQLQRFKEHSDPLIMINAYLYSVLIESQQRGYTFDPSKINHNPIKKKMTVTNGQLCFEWEHLLRKLELRDPERYKKLKMIDNLKIEAHPLFSIINGNIEDWERFRIFN